ncbi:hypothetical protein [Shewanella sp. NIFS-20-20]|uniref:hypothetical protein n=1 Tax=Shewanella sp. NIFS-20-20 TaxID=2853806 RepID=UPI001C465C3D|nr:hypothetical protein [Shewanella sp. NIFS-20-20]MBV7315610.1 hypothetical protein [Shewanella sp. NIFS-20-20]
MNFIKASLSAAILMAPLFSSNLLATELVCNDCNAKQIQQQLDAATIQPSAPIFVIDFVQAKVSKFDSQGQPLTASLSDMLHLNQVYDYRRTYLVANQ